MPTDINRKLQELLRKIKNDSVFAHPSSKDVSALSGRIAKLDREMQTADAALDREEKKFIDDMDTEVIKLFQE